MTSSLLLEQIFHIFNFIYPKKYSKTEKNRAQPTAKTSQKQQKIKKAKQKIVQQQSQEYNGLDMEKIKEVVNKNS